MFEELTLNNFCFRDDLIKECRKNLYRSDMPGYIIIRNFIDEKNVIHLRDIWQKAHNSGFFKKFPGKKKIFLGCPNYVSEYDAETKQIFYHNFLWNLPYDELSYNMAVYIQLVRNAIEGRNITDCLFPNAQRSVSFRIAISKSGNNIVKPHRDYYNLNNPKAHDIARLQATLSLSKNGVDYNGRGFVFTTNSGDKIAFDIDVDIDPGDLIIWRQSNEHSIDYVQSTPDQIGFIRIIYPPEFCHSHRTIASKIASKPIKQLLRYVMR